MSDEPDDRSEHDKQAAERTKKQLENAIIASTEVLASATTILALFPDTITLDRAKLTITHRKFFQSAEIESVRVEDIVNATEVIGPFLGSITITSRVMNVKNQTIGKFRRRDAIHMKRVIQGYVIAMQRGIDCSNLSAKELTEQLDKLGEDSHPQNAIL